MLKPKMMISFTYILLLIQIHPVDAFEFKSGAATVTYHERSDLQAFNNALYMGKLRYLMRGKRAITIEDEVKIKIDVITEKVKQVLDMHPPNMSYSFVLCKDPESVRKYSIKLHSKNTSRPAFYSPATDTVYIAVNKSTLKVVAHEVGHVVVEKYFKTRPPVKIHELLAQYAEKHITE